MDKFLNGYFNINSMQKLLHELASFSSLDPLLIVIFR